MLAVDTNVVVRYLARDDARQTERADKLFSTEQILILKTVFMETEWVLRYSYGLDRELIASALEAIAGLPNVCVEDPMAVSQALSWFSAGMDFAAALHLAASAAVRGFVTFDRKLASSAKRLNAGEVLLLH